MNQEDIPLTPQQQTGIGRPTEMTWQRFERICETLQECGQRYKSCDAHGFSYHVVRERIKERENAKDMRWRDRWELAIERYRDALEHEAHRRAFSGTEEGVWYKGNKVGTERRYSDRLMEVLLRGGQSSHPPWCVMPLKQLTAAAPEVARPSRAGPRRTGCRAPGRRCWRGR